MIHVVLPAHLQALARVNSNEVTVQVDGDVTLGRVLDALEEEYPVLRGTIRDHETKKRRAFIRFFACEQDLSHEDPGVRLPDQVTRGIEPLFVIGAIAGG